jgi:hypothetical protein
MRVTKIRWIALAGLLLAGCPTRTVYSDAGTGTGGMAGTAGAAGAGGAGGKSTIDSAGGAGETSGGGGLGAVKGRTEADASTDSGTQVDAAKPSTWCDGQRPPAGVATGDYACVDFDDGAVPEAGPWTLRTSNGGTGLVTTQHASSLPDSWSTDVSNADRSLEYLDWHTSGALPVASVVVSADLNPGAGIVAPWTGSVSLLCVQFGSCSACLNYTEGENTSFADSYHGYYLSTEYSGGGVALNQTQLYGSVQPNLWTRIQIAAVAASGSVTVTIGSTANPPVTTHFDPDTSADVLVGPQTNGTTAGWRGDIDNVVLSVSRSK